MNRSIFIIVLLLTSISAVNAEDTVIVSPELIPKKWEGSLTFGAFYFKDIHNETWTPAIGIGFERRITMPFLLGFSFQGGINDSLWVVKIRPDLIVRLPVLPRTRLDVNLSPEAVFYEHNNGNTSKDDLIPSLSAGLSLKIFIKRHTALEFGTSYSITSKDELNHFYHYIGICF